MTFIATWDSRPVEILKNWIFYYLKVLYMFLLFFAMSRSVNTILTQILSVQESKACLNVYQFSVGEIKGHNV